MQISTIAVTRCDPYIKVHQQVTVARIRADNDTLVPWAKTWYVPEHEANASYAEVVSVHVICVCIDRSEPYQGEYQDLW